jgi:chaperonin GroEL
MKEKKARVEDALHATRAAVEEGIVPGGGVALIRAQKALDNLKLEGDEAVGMAIIRRAVEAPLRTLADNAGQEGALIVQEVKKRSGNEGYNVATGEYEDLVKGRRRRSDQGDTQRVAKRRVDLWPVAHDRSSHHRSS